MSSLVHPTNGQKVHCSDSTCPSKDFCHTFKCNGDWRGWSWMNFKHHRINCAPKCSYFVQDDPNAEALVAA